MSHLAPAVPPRRFQCRHIFTDGHRCGSPCLRHENFCFYHFNTRQLDPAHNRTETIDLSQGEHRATPFALPHPEDRSAVQRAIGDVLTRLAANQLDPRRAGLLLYGLQIASLNLAPARPGDKPASATVEEVATDPDLGPLAPPVEILPPTASPHSSLSAFLLEALHREPLVPDSPWETATPPPGPGSNKGTEGLF